MFEFTRRKNQQLATAAALAAGDVASPWPAALTVETSTLCNLHCELCPSGRREPIPTGRGFMDDSLFEHLLDECAPH